MGYSSYSVNEDWPVIVAALEKNDLHVYGNSYYDGTESVTVEQENSFKYDGGRSCLNFHIDYSGGDRFVYFTERDFYLRLREFLSGCDKKEFSSVFLNNIESAVHEIEKTSVISLDYGFNSVGSMYNRVFGSNDEPNTFELLRKHHLSLRVNNIGPFPCPVLMHNWDKDVIKACKVHGKVDVGLAKDYFREIEYGSDSFLGAIDRTLGTFHGLSAEEKSFYEDLKLFRMDYVALLEKDCKALGVGIEMIDRTADFVEVDLSGIEKKFKERESGKNIGKGSR